MKKKKVNYLSLIIDYNLTNYFNDYRENYLRQKRYLNLNGQKFRKASNVHLARCFLIKNGFLDFRNNVNENAIFAFLDGQSVDEYLKEKIRIAKVKWID